MPRFPEATRRRASLTSSLILVAGGKSERAGGPKGLRAFQGRSWLAEQLERFKAAGGSMAVVVLGHSPELYATALEGAKDTGLKLEVVVNSQPERGPFSSIQCGLRALAEGQGAFVQPIDVPCPEPGVWRSLRDAAGRARPGALAALPSDGERGGHPVWISSPLAIELLSKPATSRLDEVLRELPAGAVARVEACDPSVRMNLNTPEQWETFRSRSQAALDVELGHDAGLLSIVEAGLGSVIHAFHVPGGGQLLSLNQIFLLSRSTLRTRVRSAGLRVSAIAGLLKSLSPAGKKLTPMVAISAQGALFSAGTCILGPNAAGTCLGAALASAWAFAQPLLLSYLVFGKSIFTVAQVLFDKTSELLSFPRADLWQAVFLAASLKAAAAVCLALAASMLPERLFFKYVSRLRAAALRPASRPREASASAAGAALSDLRRPIFIFPLILTFFFLWLSESREVALIYGLLRPVAIGYLIFLVVRLVSIDSIATWLQRRGHASVSRILRTAMGDL